MRSEASQEIVPPTTVEEARALRSWAETQPTRWEPAQTKSLVRHIRFMAATLPSRNIDEDTGRSRVAVYVRILGGYSEAAIAHLNLTACTTLKWFPTPSECLEILKGFTDAPTPRARALAACHSFAQQRFETFRATLKAGQGTAEMLADAPEQWKRICVEQGFLRWSKAEGFTIDRRYRGEAGGATEAEAA